jgi:hypothetical protein
VSNLNQLVLSDLVVVNGLSKLFMCVGYGGGGGLAYFHSQDSCVT